ncbi:MAG: pyridoxal phosphate-dependent aminotransferase [Campylobacteraceae bacterium]|jgi:cystathionine beta-lyase|nr:pyridoxal phosphate-dependent aminotransferase [Campylobacteraceae bacterium]
MFNKTIDRSGTNALKLERYKEYKEAIPAWVADMDFESPKCVIEALEERVKHGIFGYTSTDDDTKNAIVNFIKRYHGWSFDKDSLVFTSGVVASLNIACKMLKPNESVITTTPIYPYFLSAPENMDRKVRAVAMREIEGRWSIDFDEFERNIDADCKLFLLCNPYNPGGTVFTKDELLKIGEIALKHDLIICLDEIHAELVLNKNAKHIPIASLSPQIADKTITLMAPSKTFNIAGLQSSFAVIENAKLRARFEKSMGHINGGVNLLALTATKAAYEGGDEWLREVKEYLAENLQIVKEFVKNCPPLRLLDMDATYLAWIDCRALNTNAWQLFLKGGVVLNDGKSFGGGGDGFVRLNFAMPRVVLKEVLARMEKAVRLCTN